MNKMSLSLMVAMAAAASYPAMAQNPLPITDNDDQVRVRLIHAVPNAPAATISIGTTELFSNVEFKKVTAYKELPAQEDKKVTIKLADGSQLKTMDEFDLDDDDEAYSVVVTPDQTGPNPKVVILEDDDDAPDSDDADEADLNVINVSPQHSSITLLVDDKELIDGVDYSRSNDEDIKAGSYQLKVMSDDAEVATQQVTLEGASSYTLIVFGQNDIKLINDQSPDQPVNGATSGQTTTGTQQMATPSSSMAPAMQGAPDTQSDRMMTTMPLANPGL